MNALDNFRKGWKQVFTPYFNFLYKLFPEIKVKSAVRYMGMMRIQLTHSDHYVQYLLDSVTYKLERHSVRICEECGSAAGIRIKYDDRLPEILCLCWKCYAMEISSIDTHNSKNITN